MAFIIANTDRRDSFRGGPAVVSTLADVPLAVGDMKRHNLTVNGTDMVVRYNNARCVLAAHRLPSSI